MIKMPKVFELVKQDLSRLAIEYKLNSLEKINGNFRLVSKEFEVGPVLTPTMKIKRNVAKGYFKELIDDMYRKSNDHDHRAWETDSGYK